MVHSIGEFSYAERTCCWRCRTSLPNSRTASARCAKPSANSVVEGFVDSLATCRNLFSADAAHWAELLMGRTVTVCSDNNVAMPLRAGLPTLLGGTNQTASIGGLRNSVTLGCACGADVPYAD